MGGHAHHNLVRGSGSPVRIQKIGLFGRNLNSKSTAWKPPTDKTRSSYLVDFGQHFDLWAMKNPQRQANHLQVLASRGGGDVPWLRSHIIDDTPLQPRYQEVRSFIRNLILHS